MKVGRSAVRSVCVLFLSPCLSASKSRRKAVASRRQRRRQGVAAISRAAKRSLFDREISPGIPFPPVASVLALYLSVAFAISPPSRNRPPRLPFSSYSSFLFASSTPLDRLLPRDSLLSTVFERGPRSFLPACHGFQPVTMNVLACVRDCVEPRPEARDTREARRRLREATRGPLRGK